MQARDQELAKLHSVEAAAQVASSAAAAYRPPLSMGDAAFTPLTTALPTPCLAGDTFDDPQQLPALTYMSDSMNGPRSELLTGVTASAFAQEQPDSLSAPAKSSIIFPQRAATEDAADGSYRTQGGFGQPVSLVRSLSKSAELPPRPPKRVNPPLPFEGEVRGAPEPKLADNDTSEPLQQPDEQFLQDLQDANIYEGESSAAVEAPDRNEAWQPTAPTLAPASAFTDAWSTEVSVQYNVTNSRAFDL